MESGRKEETPADDTVGDEITTPMVFSCCKCRVIVADSFSLMNGNAEMQTITLTAASGIQRSADVYTSKAGPDVGSTYFRFTCASCQNPLGRYYLTTSKDLDNLREKFTFTIESITSYELGKPQHGKIIFTDLETGISDSPAKDDEKRVFPDGKSGDLDLSLLSVKEELSQMQHVIADLSFRLAHQEQSMHMILSHRQDKGSLDNITKNNLMDASQVQMYMRSMEGGKGTQNGRESYSINERSDQHHPRAKEGEIIKSPASTLSSGTESVAVNLLRESPMRKRSYKMQ